MFFICYFILVLISSLHSSALSIPTVLLHSLWQPVFLYLFCIVVDFPSFPAVWILLFPSSTEVLLLFLLHISFPTPSLPSFYHPPDPWFPAPAIRCASWLLPFAVLARIWRMSVSASVAPTVSVPLHKSDRLTIPTISISNRYVALLCNVGRFSRDAVFSLTIA